MMALIRVMVWAMQCGVTPFKGENKKETFKQILYNDVAFPSDVEVCVGRVPGLPFPEAVAQNPSRKKPSLVRKLSLCWRGEP
jgi:hypothetical protein